jgi:zinc protease
MTFVSRAELAPGLPVEKHQLANGLVVLLCPDRTAPIIAYQTWYRVGSRHEIAGQTGIAHLFEHLMFNQTQTLGPGELDRLVEGAGGDSNAATWVDWTYYKLNLPSTRLDLALRLEAERMHALKLDHDQVESEREVVANERRQRVDDDVEGFLAEELFRLAFDAHPYHHPTIGWMEDIQAITLEQARSFYKTFYAPNNATVVLAGDFDPGAAIVTIAQAYAGLSPSKIEWPVLAEEPPPRGPRRKRFEKAVAAQRLAMGFRAPRQADPDWLALEAVSELFFGGPSSRLYRKLVTESEAASAIDGTVTPLADPGLFEVFAALRAGIDASVIETGFLEEAARVAKGEVPVAELDKVKRKLETAFFTELYSIEGRAEAVGHYESTLGDWRLIGEVADRTRALTVDDLARAAGKWLVEDALVSVVAEPSGEVEDEGDSE